jgi:hypothetical protein
MVNMKRAEIEKVRLHSPAGEKIAPPSDILGAIVASQIDVEHEAAMVTGDQKAGLSFQEIIANICTFLVLCLCRESSLTCRDLYRVGATMEGSEEYTDQVSSGHETSGHTLAWTIDYLALYPEWQDAVHKEMTELCGDNWPCKFPLSCPKLWEDD